ncbi:MAG: YkgJ family cysteine cluster protein [Proteobacteria bacterium]|nr:YkgJ family cysteine cluster protein [Pseudomonadota bacterium]
MKDNLCDSVLSGSRKIIEEDTFSFNCHPGVKCFTRCCKDADMYLYPYDIIRMKNRFGISSEQLLEEYTFTAFRDNPYFPALMLKMSDDNEKSCPFLGSAGCTIYEDRPFSCRSYPLEPAVARSGGEQKRTVCYFMARHPYCLGHQESRKWTVAEWIEDQQLQAYNEMNDRWVDMDTLFRSNPWGPQGIDNPAFKMAYMACFNIDKFKTFIFESSFLSRFDLSPQSVEQLSVSDEKLLFFGYDWITFFLTGKGPLTMKNRKSLVF